MARRDTGSLATLSAKRASAGGLHSQYLADAIEAEERGDKTRAAVLHEKSKYWLARYNKLAETT